MLALLSALSLAAAALAPSGTTLDTTLGTTLEPRARAADSVLVATTAPRPAPALGVALRTPADTGGTRRPRAIEYSDWYARRLAIHHIASYTLLPLFAGEYVLGQQLINQQDGAANGTDHVRSGTRTLHKVTAGGIATLFGINTVTGLWNLYDSRHDPAGRGLRTTHTILMLAADAGFVVTGVIASNARRTVASDGRIESGATAHRNAALVSMGLGTVGTAIMWFRRDR